MVGWVDGAGVVGVGDCLVGWAGAVGDSGMIGLLACVHVI